MDGRHLMILYSVMNDWRCLIVSSVASDNGNRRLGLFASPMATAAALDRSDTASMRTAEEKTRFQAERTASLRRLLGPELDTIEQKLIKSVEMPSGHFMQQHFAALGGEFRGDESLDDAYLRRWLRARYWDVDNTAQSIQDHATWRLTYCPHHGRIQPVHIPSP